MQTFNLTFQGKIRPGYDPVLVRPRLAEILDIDDDATLTAAFSGLTVTLRRNLDHKTAHALWKRLHRAGAAAQLERMGQGSARHSGKSRRKGRAARRPATRTVQQATPRSEAAPPAAQSSAVPATRPAASATAEPKARPATESSAGATAPDAPSSTRASNSPHPYGKAPYRVTRELRERPQHAAELARRYLATACLAISALLLMDTLRGGSAPLPPPTGASLLAPLPEGGLALLVEGELLLHDRAGVGSGRIALTELGLASLDTLVSARDGKSLFAVGTAPAQDRASGPGPNGQASAAEGDGLANDGPAGASMTGLWRCRLAPPECLPHGPRSPPPAALAVHEFGGVTLQALPADNHLRKLDGEGALLAEARHTLSTRPTLLLRDGLLFIDSSEGPALQVLRYENQALGRQLDEILLLAPPALEAGRERVAGFARGEGKWWVLLAHPGTGDSGLYQFDEQWGFERELPMPAGFQPRQLQTWGHKLLVLDPDRPELLRFNADGQAEMPLRSNLLADEIAQRQQALRHHDLVSRLLLGLCAIALVACTAMACLHLLRYHAFRSRRAQQGAQPMDATAHQATWITRPARRLPRLRRLTQGYLGLSCLLLLIAVICRVEFSTLLALLLLLSGPGIGLWSYLRSDSGHIAALGKRLLLVDHRNSYHIASEGRIGYRGWFLAIDDILVHAGPGLLPAFEPGELEAHIVPLTANGVRLTRCQLLALMVENRHPLVVAAGLSLLGLLAALAVQLAWL
ncbi:MAG: hypothetical protein ACK5HY_06620 [Parahaliea sp.]